MSITDFYVEKEANKGKKINLKTPDGKKSDEWILILSQWSDAFQKSKSEILSDAVSFKFLPEDERKEKSEKAKIDMLIPLIAGWSFKEKLTYKNVYEFLKNAPQIREQINALAGDDSFFFKKE